MIWRYQTGGASKIRFSRKHDKILFYSKGGTWTFNPEAIHIKRTEKSLKRAQNPKGARIKTTDIYKNPDDVLIIPAMNPMAKERLGYPTQKPEALLEVLIKASSNSGDIVLDPMCGCGTTIVVAHKLGRRWVGIDISSQACGIMRERMMGLEGITEVEVIGLPLTTKDLKGLSPLEFQDYICEMTNSQKNPQKVADMGIDGYYLGEIPLQIKQQERVGRNAVDNFETALRRKRKNKGYVVAFSFTRDAYEEGARAKEDGLGIQLIRVDELIFWDYELEGEEV